MGRGDVLVLTATPREVNVRLTQNFHIDEFACKDSAKTPVPEHYGCNVCKLAGELQALRDNLGKPITVISGYRTPEHNAAVGGSKNSLHMTARAADIRAQGITPEAVHAAILRLIDSGRMQDGGLSLYPTFVHYDIRGHKARW